MRSPRNLSLSVSHRDDSERKFQWSCWQSSYANVNQSTSQRNWSFNLRSCLIDYHFMLNMIWSTHLAVPIRLHSLSRPYTCVKWRLKYSSMAFTIFSTISSLVILSVVSFNQLIVAYYCYCCCCFVVSLLRRWWHFFCCCCFIQLNNSMVMKWSL